MENLYCPLEVAILKLVESTLQNCIYFMHRATESKHNLEKYFC